MLTEASSSHQRIHFHCSQETTQMQTKTGSLVRSKYHLCELFLCEQLSVLKILST